MTTRTFIYNDHSFDDPGPDYSNEQVRTFLASQFFPELNQCDMQVGEEKDGMIEIKFVKRVTVKGHDNNLAALLTMPVAVDALSPHPTVAFLGDSPTITDILCPDNAEAITNYLTQMEALTDLPSYRYEVEKWQQLPVTPHHLPLAF